MKKLKIGDMVQYIMLLNLDLTSKLQTSPRPSLAKNATKSIPRATVK
jgi:hypothetical protein